MSAPQFTVLDVQDALVDALEARPALADVFVDDGLDSEVPEQNERLYLLRTRDLQLEDLVQQHGPRKEDYDIYVLVSVYKPDTVANTRDRADRRAAKGRVIALLDELVATLADDEELGGACRTSKVTSVPDFTATRTADGWISEAIATVHVQAWTS
jgi:hypothetical protein